MTEENFKVVIISAFDSVHVKYGVWIKTTAQTVIPGQARQAKLLGRSDLDRLF